MMVFFIYLYSKMKNNMRILTYLLAVSFVALCSCASGDDDRREMKATEIDVNDLHIYIGSAQGATEYKYEQSIKPEKLDSFRLAFIGRKLAAVYRTDAFKPFSVEFNGSKVTYIYSLTSSSSPDHKLVTNYRFENDSLFALTSDNAKMFIALGTNENNLYRMKGLCYYPLLNPSSANAAKDTVRSEDIKFDLESVFKLYGKTPGEFKEPTDTVVWLNANYRFK